MTEKFSSPIKKRLYLKNEIPDFEMVLLVIKIQRQFKKYLEKKNKVKSNFLRKSSRNLLENIKKVSKKTEIIKNLV